MRRARLLVKVVGDSGSSLEIGKSEVVTLADVEVDLCALVLVSARETEVGVVRSELANNVDVAFNRGSVGKEKGGCDTVFESESDGVGGVGSVDEFGQGNRCERRDLCLWVELERRSRHDCFSNVQV